MLWLIAILVIVALCGCLAYIGIRASEVDWGGGAINWIDGIGRLLCKYLHRLPETKIPLPDKGAAIVVSNHVSGLDPFLLLAACHRPLRFLVAREQYERPMLSWLFKASGCIPVDRSGKPELALRQALQALNDGEALAIFPHGKIHLETDPPRKLKGGAVWLSSRTQTPIYPVKIDGVGAEGAEALAAFIPSHIELTVAKSFIADTNDRASSLEMIREVIES